MDLQELRKEIDQLDTQLVELLQKRQAITSAVGAYKKEIGKPIYDPEREAELIANRRDLALSLSVSPDLVEDLLRRMIRDSYRSQHKNYSCINPGAKLVVVGGAGALGRRFVDMFERSGYEVCSIDKDDWDNIDDAVANAKLVLISVPIDLTEQVINQLPELPEDCILADITSLKEQPLKAMLNKHSGPVVGFHPMFGPDVANFVKQVVVVCEGRSHSECEWLLKQVTVWGAVLQAEQPDKHDKSMELIQAMRHFTTYVYGRFITAQNPDLNDILRLSSPIYRLELAMTGRLFAQNPSLYADIIYGASQAPDLAEKFQYELEQATNDLKAGNKQRFVDSFEQVSKWFGDKSKEFLSGSRAMLQSAHDARDLK